MTTNLAVNEKITLEIVTRAKSPELVYEEMVKDAVQKGSYDRESLLRIMKGIVESIVERYHNDFYYYDMVIIETMENTGVEEMLWYVYDCGTHAVSDYRKPVKIHQIRAIERVFGCEVDKGARLFKVNIKENKIKEYLSFKDFWVNEIKKE